MRIVFLNHPLGAIQADNPWESKVATSIEMQNNIATAYEWMRFLIRFVVPKIVILTPAIAWAAAEVAGKDILKMMSMTLPRCDSVIDVFWPSEHMGSMRRQAHNAGLPLIDLTKWGQFPPWKNERAIKEIVAKINDETRGVKPRAHWLPPLTDVDVTLLREIEEMLVTDPENIDRLQALRTILNAASKP